MWDRRRSMRSVLRLLAIRYDTGFRSLPYMLEAKAHSLLLIPLHRRWLITSTLFSAFFMVPVIVARALGNRTGRQSLPRRQVPSRSGLRIGTHRHPDPRLRVVSETRLQILQDE